MSNFLYIDPSLDGLNNHHEAIYIPVIKELLNKGFNVHSITNISYKKKSLGEKIINQLTYTTNTKISKDNISGWLSDYIDLSNKIAYDFERLINVSDYDYIYCNSFNAPMIYGLNIFLERLKGKTSKLPKKIFVEIPLPPGFEIDGDSLFPEYKEAYLYRHCLNKISLKNIFFGAFCQDTCWAYKKSCDKELLLFPTPRSFNIELNPEFISFLGSQRVNKGLDLLPTIASHLAKNNHNILIHDSPPGKESLKKLANENKTIEYLPILSTENEWHSLISRSRVIVLPYNPKRYKYSYSSIFVESLYFGVPCIVPCQTSMETIYKKANINEYLVFDKWAASSIITTIEKLMSRYSQVSKDVQMYSKEWRLENSPKKFVEFLLN